jgi:hypothetical protein
MNTIGGFFLQHRNFKAKPHPAFPNRIMNAPDEVGTDVEMLF